MADAGQACNDSEVDTLCLLIGKLLRCAQHRKLVLPDQQNTKYKARFPGISLFAGWDKGMYIAASFV